VSLQILRGHPEIKERFAIKKYLLVIGKEKNMQVLSHNKETQIPSKHNKIYSTLPLLDYMFRLLRVIIRSSSELIQNYLIPSALWDPVVLTIVGAMILWVHVSYYSVYGYLCYYITM
jgi:hypothetical protein